MTDLHALSKSDPPATVTEAVDRLLDILGEDDQQAITDLSKDRLIDLHFGLGADIRNAWLWSSTSVLRADCEKCDQIAFDPDGCSGLIVERLWARLQRLKDEGAGAEQ